MIPYDTLQHQGRPVTCSDAFRIVEVQHLEKQYQILSDNEPFPPPMNSPPKSHPTVHIPLYPTLPSQYLSYVLAAEIPPFCIIIHNHIELHTTI